MCDKLTICGGCMADGAAVVGQLRAGLAAGDLETQVAMADCQNVCGRPVSVSFRAPGKWAYLFAGVDIAVQAVELIAFARLYAASVDGSITDARACGQLRLCLIGRIPA